MKAHVDRRGCIACGLCVATCPEVFQFEDGLSSVIVDEIPEYCLDDAQVSRRKLSCFRNFYI